MVDRCLAALIEHCEIHGETDRNDPRMRYGFVIDQNRCIGCHACTVACKEEHNVPIGVYRTWVKYIEKGEFPDTKRYFGVLRCNHCDDAPCIEICPTVALFRRADGIVDFDSERCIGCKSCMQACPYDALYMDPRSQTAAKCNFCAHRVERGLEPACVIVCPEQAIIAGDLDDPTSRISRIVTAEKVSTRKPEKGTRPKLFYVGVDGDLLRPTMTEAQQTYLWAEKKADQDLYASLNDRRDRPAPGASRAVYDVSHPRPWGTKIASYLWTKSIAAGVLLVAALLLHLGYEEDRWLLNRVGPVLALSFVGATTLLLIFDLRRPERFYYLLTKPNLNSWLVLGGYILILYGLLAFLWLLFGLSREAVPEILYWSAAVLGICSACYSAFLFTQAKGRDFWQSPLFLWHLLLQAITAGSAVLVIFGALLQAAPSVIIVLGKFLGISLVITLALILAEMSLARASEEGKRAGALLRSGALSAGFWGLVVGLGILLPLLLLIASAFQGRASPLTVLAALFALVGLWVFEDLWIKAGQAVPLS